MNLRTLRGQAEARLREAGIDTPELDARYLLEHALTLTRTDFVTKAEQLIPDADAAHALALVERRVAREPVGRILGHREFWTIDLALNPDTLEPRPDTETVVEAVLAAIPDRKAALRLIDFGTGTGCILLALLSELPNATGVGVDLSPLAVEAAAGNADRNGLAERARFQTGDWAKGIEERFDIVVSNPPYIPSADIATLEPEVREHDPLRALDGGPDGLEPYRILAAELPRLLVPGGLVAFEVGQGQAEDVAALVGAQGVGDTAILCDLGGVKRCVRARKSL
ncbi:peptide chain release factor N(5)-glutamine methyltransferase [Azospirillum melinis]|uniref:Release factor glutamine methyltransferase n=1 Tax=Azospirillum melinis TaxID=328839 RepID=A0ABX2KRQ5_9PROT|nr:peptide chain release factor N(5)-glutamine methyltransferase [Azospirillum melinis]MBP2309009.1 release factor glutamine methyltransferase [Azospirillum melinis]NUB04478.1 peptide chain release factor N(5)-glutamine methyltransferase [Azospirillum melinis]